jgi:glycosyltransferase involved in cell wall biosynthesis
MDKQLAAEPISILVPTYNRRKFLPLLLQNLQGQIYPKPLLELVIDDDGEEPLISEEDRDQFAEQIKPITMKYIYNKKRRKSIGEKRNRLVKYATNKICAFMDDDDIYHPHYLAHSYYLLKTKRAGLVGSNCMIFTYPEMDFKITAIRCKYKSQIHEATMLFTKKYFESMGGFLKTNKAEGQSFIQNRDHDVELTDINSVMVCVAHNGNTIDKGMFADKEVGQNLENEELKELIKNILELK